MTQNMNIGLLLAAGKSNRFGKNQDKLFALLGGKPVISYSLKLFENSNEVDEIYIAVNSQNRSKINNLVRKMQCKKVKKIFLGGETRFESVTKIIPNLFRGKKLPRFIIIQNAANPLAIKEEISRCIKALNKPLKGGVKISGAAVGRKIHSTIKKSDSKNLITISRQNLWEVETPQVVIANDFLMACEKVCHSELVSESLPSIKLRRINRFRIKSGMTNKNFTDDLSVLEGAGMKTIIVSASSQNRKITEKSDLEMLEKFLGEDILAGIGEDSHAFSLSSKSAKYLVLGGVKIKNLPALKANSDGDVILHALCNAIASALGEGSLGTYATKMCNQGVKDSKQYLKAILRTASSQNRVIKNCAIAIETKRPRVDSLVPAIKKSLSNLLKIPISRIGITAHSGEKLTPFGQGKAIRVQAIVQLKKLSY